MTFDVRNAMFLDGAVIAGSGRLRGNAPNPSVIAGVSWNPSDKSADMVLSGGNLVATTTTHRVQMVRGTTAHSTGKFYLEYAAVSSPAFGVGQQWYAGFANATEGLSLTLGGSLNSVADIESSVGAVWQNAVPLQVIDHIASGNVRGVAIDLDASKIWVRKAPSGNWNNSGSANPATGAGGITFTTLGTTYAAFGGIVPGLVCTVNFGATAYVGTAPSGFGNWT